MAARPPHPQAAPCHPGALRGRCTETSHEEEMERAESTPLAVSHFGSGGEGGARAEGVLPRPTPARQDWRCLAPAHQASTCFQFTCYPCDSCRPAARA